MTGSSSSIRKVEGDSGQASLPANRLRTYQSAAFALIFDLCILITASLGATQPPMGASAHRDRLAHSANNAPLNASTAPVGIYRKDANRTVWRNRQSFWFAAIRNCNGDYAIRLRRERARALNDCRFGFWARFRFNCVLVEVRYALRRS